jgi:hypothetical protein
MSGKPTIIVRTHYTYTPAGTGFQFTSLEAALSWLEFQSLLKRPAAAKRRAVKAGKEERYEAGRCAHAGVRALRGAGQEEGRGAERDEPEGVLREALGVLEPEVHREQDAAKAGGFRGHPAHVRGARVTISRRGGRAGARKSNEEGDRR